MIPKSQPLRAARQPGRRFLRARGGNVAMLWALGATVIIGLIGLSVDFARAQAIRSEMQNAVDGAVLVAQRNIGMTLNERTNAARAFFDQSLGTQQDTSGLSFAVTQLQPAGHRVEASLNLATGLSRVLNLITGTDHNTLRIAVAAEATSQVSPPIELVMALDNTYSMVNDIEALRDAAHDLADSLFDLTVDPDDIRIGVVPFEAYVNIGNGATQMAWMDTAGTAPLHGEILEQRLITKRSASSAAQCNGYSTTVGTSPYPIRWEYQTSGSSSTRCWGYNPDDGINFFTLFDQVPNASWKGCVEARPEPYDINDAAPTSPETRFVPFFYLDDSDNTGGVPNNWLNDATLPSGTIQSGGRTLSVFKYDGTNGSLNETHSTTNARGPNRGCPTPITPLTNNRNTVLQAIANMRVWLGGGTNSAEGLAWGWRVVSHGAPFTEGRDPAVDPVRKVVVLMTDGENTNYNATSENGVLQSYNNAFSYRGQWTNFQNDVPVVYRRNVGNSQSSYENYVDNRLRSLCDNVKDDDVEVYTVVFREPSQNIRTLLRNCASGDDHAFTADSQAELASAFEAIGQGVGQLRLSR